MAPLKTAWSSPVPHARSAPQSVIARFRYGDSAGVESVTVCVSVKSPPSEPVFWIVTVPVEPVPPGLRFEAVRTAVPSLLLAIDSVPDENVLAALAELELNEALEPTVRPAPTRTAASAPRVRR